MYIELLMKHLSRRAKIIIITTSVFLTIILIVLVRLLLTLNNPQNKNTVSDEEPKAQNQITQFRVTKPPKPIFEEWIEEENTYFNENEINVDSTIYTFKTSYSDKELTQLAISLGINNQPTIVNSINVYTNYATDSASIMSFDKETSNLLYFSTDGIQLTENNDVFSNISRIVTTLGLYDEKIKIFASYKKKNEPNIRYYELHRDWDLVGYPILNPVGLLNLSEDQSLRNLNFNDGNLPKDDQIYETSDSKDGYTRANDFNTMAIGIDEKRNKLVSINSNIRPFSLSQMSISKNDLLTKNEALERLNDQVYGVFLPEPSGKGATDFAKVFPANLAKGKRAVINEVSIAYLELPSSVSQTLLRPYYLFRGYSELDSGYRINFVVGVVAQKNPDVAGVSTFAQSFGGQQQGTLKFSDDTPAPTQAITIKPTNVLTTMPSVTIYTSPVVTDKPINNELCKFKEKDYIAIYEFEGLKYGLAYPIMNWYLIPNENSDFTADEYIEIINRLMKHLENNPGTFPSSVPITSTLRPAESLIQDIDFYKGCPIRMTGISPSLFIYGPLGSSFSLEPNFELTYKDPPLNESTWLVDTLNEDYIRVNNVLRKYIYYEYKPISFSKPSSGWIIEKNKLSELSKILASKLRFNTIESSRLLFELEHVAAEIEDQYLFVGLINQSEINRKLPLKIAPKIVNTQRYHFYVKGLNKNTSIRQPNLTPVVRTETMMLELGAIKGK